MASPYPLHRDALTISQIVLLADKSVREALAKPEQDQRRVFLAGIGRMLPGSDARSLGFHWAPRDDAPYDDWIRYGAYHGARAAWIGYPCSAVANLSALTTLMVQAAQSAAYITTVTTKANQ